MANEKSKGSEEGKIPQLSYDWNILGYANVAKQFLSQGKAGVAPAGKSLELILKDIKRNEPWLTDALQNPNVLAQVIESQIKTYETQKNSQSIGDILTHYDKDLTKFLGDHAEAAAEALEPFKEMKYSDLMAKMDEAAYIAKGKKFNRSTDEEVESAKKIIESYSRVKNTIDMLESLYHERFQLRVNETMIGEGLKEMYPKPKKEDKEGK